MLAGRLKGELMVEGADPVEGAQRDVGFARGQLKAPSWEISKVALDLL